MPVGRPLVGGLARVARAAGVLLLHVGLASAAEPGGYARYDGLPVARVQFEGVGRLTARRLARFMDTRPGRPFDHRVFSEDLRRLRNLELFRKLKVRIRRTRQGLVVRLHVQFKWSLLPYFNYFQGGGSWEIVTGLYDANVARLVFLLDGRLILFDGKPAGILFFGYPRMGGLPLDLDANGGYSLSIRTTYRARGIPWRRYRTEVAWLQLLLRWEPMVWLRLGAWYLYRWRRYAFARFSPTRDFLPPEGHGSSVGLLLSVGKLAYHDYFMHGLSLDVLLSTAQPWLGSEFTQYRAVWDARGYWYLGPRWGNLTAWLRGGYETGPTTLVEEFALGGLLGLRGFQHGQYLGRAYVAGTLEYRSGFVATAFPVMSAFHPIFRGKCLRFQGVVFTDMGAVAGSSHQANPESGKLLASVGAGFRAIFVRFYRAVLRVDLAVTLSPYVAYDLVIATQQSF